MLDWNVCIRYVFFNARLLLIISLLISSSFKFGLPFNEESVFIANTIDGSFIGLNLITGAKIWEITGPKLVSQSLSSLELILNTKSYTIVPSLNGQLFLMERKITGDGEPIEASLRALPLNVESLFSSNFMLTEDSLLTGGKDHTTFSFDPTTGMVHYNCSRDGCADFNSDVSFPSEDSESVSKPSIIAYGINNIVRAISPPKGIEKWNLSVRDYNLCLISPTKSDPTPALQKLSPKCLVNGASIPDTIDPAIYDEPNLEFSLDTQSVIARGSPPYSETLWSHTLNSRIIKAWIYRNDVRSLRTVSLFTRDRLTELLVRKIEEFDQKPPIQSQKLKIYAAANVFFENSMKQLSRGHPFDCPARDRLVYLGDYNNQFYVQLEDGLDSPNLNWINLSENRLATKPTSSSPTITGYYRASSSQSKSDKQKHKPFITMENSNGFSNQRKTVTDLAKFIPPIESHSHNQLPTDINDNNILDQANDLIMLLLKASENIVKHPPNTLNIMVSGRFNIYVRLFQITLVTGLLYFTAQWIMSVCIEYNCRLKQGLLFFNNVPSWESVTVKITNTPNQSADNSPFSNTNNSSATPTDTHPQPCPNDFISTFENDFKFIRLLGRGGFGQVFEVKNLLDGCHYAIKRIKMNVMDDDKNKFLREVKALASLEHSGIVRYHRAWKEYPPCGWQEARDKLLDIQSDGESGTNLRSSSSLLSETNYLTESELSCRMNKNAGVKQPESHIEDSLIAFETPSISQTNKHNDSKLSSIDSVKEPKHQLMSADPKSICYLYIQMQLCSPTSLRDWLSIHNSPDSRPPRMELYHMFYQIVDAVAYLHTNALVHRDLKPSNILFDLNNRLKLADFGLVTWMLNDEMESAVLDSEADNDKQLFNKRKYKLYSVGSDIVNHKMKSSHTNNVGTDLYMSPEQERGDRYNHKVDIFSLGLIFIELMLTFNTNMERICTLANAKQQILPKVYHDSYQKEADFVLQLLHGNPIYRPSAVAILQNNLLRNNMENN